MKRIKLPKPKLEVRDLELMLALTAAGTTAEAASELHLTQSAVSRALLSLEGRLGVSLFERSRAGLTPTPRGKALLEHARRLLAEISEVEQLVCGPKPTPARMRVVCECYTAYHWVPSALQRLRRQLPGLELSLAIEHRADPARALSDGKVDAALVTSARLPKSEVHERPLFSDEIVFALSSAHPLAARKFLTRADLQGNPLLAGTTPATESLWFMRQVFGRARPVLQFERLPLTEAVLDVARAGMGIAVLSEWIATPHVERGGLVIKRLDTGPLRRPWRFAWRRDLGDMGERLWEVLKSTVPRKSLPATRAEAALVEVSSR